MRQPTRWRVNLRTRQRARTTLNAKWFDPVPASPPPPAAPPRDEGEATANIDHDGEETPPHAGRPTD